MTYEGRLKIGSDFLKIGALYLRIGMAPALVYTGSTPSSIPFPYALTQGDIAVIGLENTSGVSAPADVALGGTDVTLTELVSPVGYDLSNGGSTFFVNFGIWLIEATGPLPVISVGSGAVFALVGTSPGDDPISVVATDGHTESGGDGTTIGAALLGGAADGQVTMVIGVAELEVLLTSTHPDDTDGFTEVLPNTGFYKLGANTGATFSIDDDPGNEVEVALAAALVVVGT